MNTKGLMKVDPIVDLLETEDEIFPLAPISPVQTMSFPQLFGKEMHMKVEETGKHYTVSLKTPGYDKKHLKVSVKDGILTFCGERQEENRTKNGYSSSYGSFTRSIPLPSEVRPKGAKVEVHNGEVKITMDKKPCK